MLFDNRLHISVKPAVKNIGGPLLEVHYPKKSRKTNPYSALTSAVGMITVYMHICSMYRHRLKLLDGITLLKEPQK